MADLPVEKPLSVEDRIANIEKDVLELARGVNVQASLLQSIVAAFESVLKTYLVLTAKPEEKPNVEEKSKE